MTRRQVSYINLSTQYRAMRAEARGLTQHGGPPGWLEESDPVRDVHDGRFMPPALVCSCSAAILANRDAVADVLVLVAQKTPS